MRILHVNLNLVEGGLERVMALQCAGLAARGHDNLVLHGRPERPDCAVDGARCACVPWVTHVRCPDLGDRLADVRELLRRERPDVALLNHVFCPELVDLLTRELPCVRFVHDVELVCCGRKMLNRRTPSGAPEPCLFPLGPLCQARAYIHRCMPRDPRIGLPLITARWRIVRMHRSRTRMAAPSGYIRGVLLHNGFAPARVQVIEHFVPTPHGEPSGPQFPADAPPLVLFAARVNKGKGLDVLLAALAHLPRPVRLVVAGDGPDLPAMRELAERLGVAASVEFAGWMDRMELEALRARAALAVVPSVCPESFALVGLEAMAHALPVVGSDSGGITQWLEHGVTGLLVPPRDAAALAGAMDAILADQKLARSMGRAGYAAVRGRFTPERHLDALEALLALAASEGAYAGRAS
ncbi:glycosyltransferase involved in cell wall biosynthesis [Desulfobaculum xiamenense]|uniref:Glycosyltransferase involved in cell wall biosynthesis n=1 Tax=Desulfobaculum xiamenense TaxID=995050 RepID=A0A846QJP2_9BACT|nr:glycosyltransferase family 4 protein [Desulfobaculum xiamenense]NJB68361.1 glycosyltransferase involved in cell wall biosynthesis [Desulfobaculum xiamenense]